VKGLILHFLQVETLCDFCELIDCLFAQIELSLVLESLVDREIVLVLYLREVLDHCHIFNVLQYLAIRLERD